MQWLSLPQRKDFKDEYDIVREELRGYGIEFTEKFDNIRGCNTINFKSKTMEASIGFHDYFIKYKDIVVNKKHYVLTTYQDDIIDFWWNSIPNISGGCYFEYINTSDSKGIDQYLFEFLDRYGFPCEKIPRQLSIFDL